MIQVHVDVIFQSSQGICYLIKTSIKKTPFVSTSSKIELKNVNKILILLTLRLLDIEYNLIEYCNC